MKLNCSRSVVTVAAIALLVGCAGTGRGSDPFSDRSRETEVKIFITNLAFSDVTLYGIINGGRHRLGRVTGKRDFVFTVPMRMSSEFQIELDFLAGPKCYTERMREDPGDHLDLTIQNEGAHYRCRGS